MSMLHEHLRGAEEAMFANMSRSALAALAQWKPREPLAKRPMAGDFQSGDIALAKAGARG